MRWRRCWRWRASIRSRTSAPTTPSRRSSREPQERRRAKTLNPPIPPFLALVGRTHLLLLHFPIALLFAVVVLELVFARRIPEDKRRQVTSALLLITMIAAVVTTATGLLYGWSEDFHGHTQVLLSQHRI